MKPEDKKYVLKNLNKKSLKEISQNLGIKERKVRKFLERVRKSESKKQPAREPTDKKTILISVALIIILGFTVYANSLSGKFIRDDITLIRDNIYIQNWSKAPKLFSVDIATGGKQKWNSYRPFQMITYAIDYSIWKLNVKGYHLTNIFCHILVSILIYWFINILFDNKLLSLFTSVLFVINPLHTEAVSYISGRADSLSVIFMLLCFILYIKLLDTDSITLYLFMLLSYILAILSRENSLILPALLLLYHYSFKKKLKLNIFLSFIGIAFLYILLRFTILESILSNIAYSSTVSERMPGFFVAITNYIKLILLPFNLHANYGNKLFSFVNPRAVLGIIILATLSVYAFKIRKRNALVFFSLSWFFITLLPQSNLYPINAYMAEHWLYLPLVGFALILAKGLVILYKRGLRILSIVLLTFLLGFYSYNTIKQNDYWREPISFYEKTLRYVPDDYKEYINLGNVYRDMGKHQEAIVSYKKAMDINPADENVYNNLGVEYYEIGDKEGAIPLFKKAIEINPNYATAYNSLGRTYYEFGKREEAIATYKKAIEIDPDYTSPYYNLGEIYTNNGKYEEAIVSYKKAIEINPNYADAYNNLGVAYSNSGKKAEAVSSFKKAVENNPNYTEAYNNLALIYYSLGKANEAITMFKKVIEIEPSHMMAHCNLGVIYYEDKRYGLAVKYFEKAIELGYIADSELTRFLTEYRQKHLKSAE